MKASIPPAAAVRPGMQLRKQHPYGPDHIVEDVARLENGSILITTNVNQWTFEPFEDVTFPRRLDGTKRNWSLTDPPQVVDLAVGDTLRPWDGSPPPVFSPDDPEHKIRMLTTSYQMSLQTVTYVAADIRGQQIVNIGLTSLDVRHRRMTCHLSDVITFPYSKSPAMRLSHFSASSSKVRPLHVYGPYRRASGALFGYVRHPTGRGRWPLKLELGFDVQVAEDTVRIQREAGDWDQVRYLGKTAQGRHHKDPLCDLLGRRPEDEEYPHMAEWDRVMRSLTYTP